MTIVITDDDVKRLLSMEECIDAMRTVFSDLADGKAASLGLFVPMASNGLYGPVLRCGRDRRRPGRKFG